MKKFIAFLAGCILAASLTATLAAHAQVKISALPLGSAASTTNTDSFPYVNSTTDTTARLTLWDLVNLPPFQSVILPSQTGNSGKYLTTNGTSASWAPIVSGVSSFNTRTGAVTFAASDWLTALATPTPSSTSVLEYNGTNFSWVSPSSIGGVSSFNSRTGAVSFLASDFLLALATPTPSATSVLEYNGTNFSWVSPSVIGGVTSFNTRTGAVTLSAADVGAVIVATPTPHEWLTGISSAGAFSFAQPAFTDVSGTVAAAQGGTGLNTSSSTGVPSVSGGTWSINSTLPLSLGGTGINASSTNNLFTSLSPLSQPGDIIYGTTIGTAGVVHAGANGSIYYDASGIPATFPTPSGSGSWLLEFNSSTSGFLVWAATPTPVPSSTPPQAGGWAEGSPTPFNVLQFPNSQVTNLGSNKLLVENGNGNMLVNPNFMSSTPTTGWTVTNATTSPTPVAGLPYTTEAIQVTPSATPGALLVQDVTTGAAASGLNFEYTLWANNTAAGRTICSRQNGTEISSNCNTILTDGNWHQYTLNYPAGTTSAGIEVDTTGASATAFYLSGGYVGDARNVGTVAQAYNYGTMSMQGASTANTCQWIASSTGLANQVALSTSGTACASSWASTGGITAPASTDYRPTITNAPAGVYTVRVSGNFFSSSTASTWMVSDGTTNTGFVYGPTNNNATQSGPSTLTGTFSYAGTGTRIFNIVCSTSSSTNCGLFNGDATYSQVNWSIDYAPSAGTGTTVVSINNPNYTNMNSIASAPATTIGATTTAPTKGTIAFDSVQSQLFGDHGHIRIDYQQSAAGSSGSGDYLLTLPNGWSFDSTKVTFYTGNGGVNPWNAPTALGTANFENVPTSGIGTNAFGVIVPYNSTQFRIAFQYTSVSGTVASGGGYWGSGSANFTLSLAGTTTVTADFFAPLAGHSNSAPVPVLTGSVFAPGENGQEAFARVFIGGSSGSGASPAVCTGTCSIYNQNASWFSAPTRASTGRYTLTVASGLWSDWTQVVCTCSGIGGPTSCVANMVSATTLDLADFSGGTVTDGYTYTSCFGPH